jgi:hypothetical protein
VRAAALDAVRGCGDGQVLGLLLLLIGGRVPLLLLLLLLLEEALLLQLLLLLKLLLLLEVSRTLRFLLGQGPCLRLGSSLRLGLDERCGVRLVLGIPLLDLLLKRLRRCLQRLHPLLLNGLQMRRLPLLPLLLQPIPSILPPLPCQFGLLRLLHLLKLRKEIPLLRQESLDIRPKLTQIRIPSIQRHLPLPSHLPILLHCPLHLR